MNVKRLGELLREELDGTGIAAPERTGIFMAASDNLTMSRAYLADGNAFFSSGDFVNALAAYCYGEGWLHCGASCGLVCIAAPRCLPGQPVDPLPPDSFARLSEKTHRYDRLLATARDSVRPAPETGTALYIAAERVGVVTALYARQGRRYLAREEPENALACFSYGHGWLDAGVRAGLYTVTANRDIFTIG